MEERAGTKETHRQPNHGDEARLDYRWWVDSACKPIRESLTGVLPFPVLGLRRPFRALVDSCGAREGVGQLQMLIPDPRCARTERFRCRWYIASLTGLPAFLELTAAWRRVSASRVQ